MLFGEISCVQHTLQGFYGKVVGMFGNVILIQHPEVIKVLESAVAHTKLNAEWGRLLKSAYNHWTWKIPLLKLSTELITQKSDSGQLNRNLYLVLWTGKVFWIPLDNPRLEPKLCLGCFYREGHWSLSEAPILESWTSFLAVNRHFLNVVSQRSYPWEGFKSEEGICRLLFFPPVETKRKGVIKGRKADLRRKKIKINSCFYIVSNIGITEQVWSAEVSKLFNFRSLATIVFLYNSSLLAVSKASLPYVIYE